MIQDETFFKGFTPKELTSYVNDFPNRAEDVKQFLMKYKYVNGEWIK